ncbi:MAG: hypothetical protein Q8R78_02675 [Candidatus Omnitrophota bacterium]|nr:hypothetical protein [Candidatus Omnitrophota bacterium]
MAPVTKPLIDVLQQAITFIEKREATPSGDYFEGVLSRGDLARACELLEGTFGPAAKEFGKVVKFAGQHQIMVKQIGGVQPDQCLFIKDESNRPIAFAALWPWASNPQRVTLKVGVFPR